MLYLWSVGKKYDDPKLDKRDKVSYLRLAIDCNKVIEEMDNLRQKNYHGSGSSSTQRWHNYGFDRSRKKPYKETIGSIDMDEVQNELLNKIKVAVENPNAIHILDERRVACILYNYFIKISGAAIDDIDILMSDLPSKYSEFTKRRIHEIAYVAELLTHCEEHGFSND